MCALTSHEMQSFTLRQYLYLLFDEDNRINDDDSNYVFTTEGHILMLDHDLLKKPKHGKSSTRKFISHQCPTYYPYTTNSRVRGIPGLTRGIRSRPEAEYARLLVGNKPTLSDERHWQHDGWCDKPKTEAAYVSSLRPSSDPRLTRF